MSSGWAAFDARRDVRRALVRLREDEKITAAQVARGERSAIELRHVRAQIAQLTRPTEGR